MQKLLVKLKNTPTDASQVCSSVNSVLNKEGTLSVQNKVLANNNPEVNRVSTNKTLVKSKVFVLNKQGLPLMPCSYAKSKRMVKKGGAKVVKRYPFTIQLTFDCENKTQDITLGIDTGFGNIGFSAVSEKEELISGTLKLDGRTKERLDERRMYRRCRRNKLWYRKARFSNRKKKEGWLPPSTQRRYDTHLNLINGLKKILPITLITVEVAKFDIQKIENPDIQGKEYQQGNLYEYQNTRSYLMAREKGKCQLCSKDFKGQPSHLHHCKQRNEAGSNRPENLALLHKVCHTKLHRKGLKLFKPKEYKANIFMSIINKRFWKDVSNLKVTYGNTTFVDRNNLELEKSHVNDAFVIANGSSQRRCKAFSILQKRRANRALQLNRKGFKLSIRKQRYNLQPHDLVKVNNLICTVIGTHCKGTRVMINKLDRKVSESIKNIEWSFHFGSFTYN